MEPKAMGFEMKVKTICRPLLFIFDSTSLQYFGIRWNAMGKPSHLLQMRGLKRETDAKVNLSEVASFTDAWIETADNTEEYQPPFSRIFYRCVD